MLIVCPRCRRNLPSTEEPPSFCSFCGHRLRESSTERQATASVVGDGSTVAQAGPGLSPEVPMEEPTPTQIGDYRLHRLLGVGGMGRVYEAESISSRQKVAVKLLSSRLSQNPASVERFRQEGRLASQLSHPRCVFVLEADTELGQPYIVMELMPGDTIKDLIDRRGPLPPQEAIQLILDVIDGLHEAHRFGVIHRDVKPSNCFTMPDGRVKIGDFGLSKSLSSDGHLTQTGAFLGTVLYASPEQIRGETVEYASDVYSVCATLFHMLAGRPPFVHENITAALAKIISEDAPSLRSIRPDVPRPLAKVVAKGLERDRTRRWQNLDELRAALVALVPSHLSYGGLPVRIGAYLLDELFVRVIIVLPLSILLSPQFGPRSDYYLTLFLFPLYFVFLEGLFGASLGKRVLRLRVCRSGSTEPPGLRRAVIRTLAFYVLMAPALLFQVGISGVPGLLFAGVPFIAGLLLLIVPMRKSNDFRGMHEMLSGTCVMKLPRRIAPITLSSMHGNRLLSLPPRRAPIPEIIGPYQIKGAVANADGGHVLVGEDSLLGRKILLQLFPASQAASSAHSSSNRPTRSRLLQSGTISIAGKEFEWEAYVAPVGSALRDVVQTHRRLTWRETRPLLEQLAEELQAAQKEGKLPQSLGIDQLWVQRDGRLQLLEFPVPRHGETTVHSTGPMDLLCDVATLALEGQVRLAGLGYLGPIRIPAPYHAAKLLDRLLGGPKAFGGLENCRSALHETHELPTHVDHALRVAHLTVQGASLSLGLLFMFVFSGLFGLFAIIQREQHYESGMQVLASLSDPAERQRFQNDRFLKRALDDEVRFRAKLEDQLRDDVTAVNRLKKSRSFVERFLYRVMDVQKSPEDEREVVAGALPNAAKQNPEIFPQIGSWRHAAILILAWPAIWAAGAFVARGGLSYMLLGVRIVNRTGRRAARNRCALRALLVWLPIALLLCASAFCQSEWPDLVYPHSLCWLAALVALPVYFAVALINPERSPLDRLLGTQLVPK